LTLQGWTGSTKRPAVPDRLSTVALLGAICMRGGAAVVRFGCQRGMPAACALVLCWPADMTATHMTAACPAPPSGPVLLAPPPLWGCRSCFHPLGGQSAGRQAPPHPAPWCRPARSGSLQQAAAAVAAAGGGGAGQAIGSCSAKARSAASHPCDTLHPAACPLAQPPTCLATQHHPQYPPAMRCL
jgi:hypothetical protein